MRVSIIISFVSFLHLINMIFGYSMQFGYMQAKSVPIYEKEIRENITSNSQHIYDIVYIQEDRLNFKITLILVFDESQVELDCEKMFISIYQGGIGYNFTTIRLQYNLYLDWQPIKLTILIYGGLEYNLI
ncbi:uncharacterized protein LOC111518847 [Drosophila willistoni]|uniref:uncharacterized protein LOC111518847 n=1 Tax=Drosophila willistoni TaxID=7260 RepID=UPI001F079763|nr:uncharacterized protein LOC111518847 [Drosophila willistoni]